MKRVEVAIASAVAGSEGNLVEKDQGRYNQPRSLFMYLRRFVTEVEVAKASAAAISKVAVSNGHCIDIFCTILGIRQI